MVLHYQPERLRHNSDQPPRSPNVWATMPDHHVNRARVTVRTSAASGNVRPVALTGRPKGSPLGDFAVCGDSYAAGRMVPDGPG